MIPFLLENGVPGVPNTSNNNFSIVFLPSSSFFRPRLRNISYKYDLK